ncbi:MAG: HAD family hydrolase [Deltaproteobacteria bacterium]|nr:HAD family hydrolase [Deltaproteobacteria bacterium]
MHRYDAVLLDVDGTLVDSNDAHAHAWVEVLAAHGFDVAYPVARRMIGMGGDRLIAEVGGPARGTKENEKIGKARAELFRKNWLQHVKPLPGARELVLRLRAEGYKYAIASAAKAEELKPLLEIAELVDLCEIKTTSSDVEESKPDPEIVEAAVAKLPVDRSRTVMIGDTPYDLEAASGASVDLIGVTSGGWSIEELGGAVAVYRDPADLLAHWSESPLGRATV